MRIGGWALHLGAVNVPFVSVTFIQVAAVVIIVALTASLPFRILIPTSNIGRTNLLSHWCCIVGWKDCIQDFDFARIIVYTDGEGSKPDRALDEIQKLMQENRSVWTTKE